MQILFLSLTLLFQSSPADTTVVNSEVQSATVYLSGAQVQRTSSVNLQRGTNYIQFTGLSSSLREESIQLDTGGNLILESISKTAGTEENHSTSDKFNDLESRKEVIADSINHKQAALSVLNKRLNFLAANQDLSGDNATVSASEIKQAMDYFTQQYNRIENKKIEIAKQLKTLREELNDIDQQIEQLKRKNRRAGGAILMAVQSEQAQEVTFLLRYFVPAARWYPSYDVRVDETDGPLNLRYKANIRQNTGVDWRDVNLTISSADPRRTTTLPSIDPVYIDFFRIQRQKININAELALDEPGQAAALPVQTQLREGQTTFSFEIENRYTIKSDAPEKTVAVESYRLPAKYYYQTIPKKHEKAFLTAQVGDWESLNLLRGQASLFLGQSFVGKTVIQPSTVQDTLSFTLGKDKGVVVERIQIESFQEKNFFGNKVTETKGWDITVRNTKSTAINLNVLDQVPLSSNEDIEIDLKERSGASFDESTGKLKWNIELEPGQAKTLRFVYEITYPDDQQITRQ
jgi:uncharacterized protein (TIGR02231 family)